MLSELESIKPEFQRRVDEIEKAYSRTQQVEFNGSGTSTLEWPPANKNSYSGKVIVKEFSVDLRVLDNVNVEYFVLYLCFSYVVFVNY